MFSFLSDREDDILGIDVGTATVKVVELERKGDQTLLTNYGQAKMREYQSTIKDVMARHAQIALEEVVGEILKGLVDAMHVKTRGAVMSIPVTSSFLTTIAFPAALSLEELESAVPYEAASYVPLPLAEVELDWIALEEREAGSPPEAGSTGSTSSLQTGSPQAADKKQVLVVAVPKEVIEKYQRIAALANIDLKGFEIETFSLARSCLARMPDAVLLDVGASSASVTVVQSGMLRMTHALDVTGNELTRAVAQGLRISVARAEDAKTREGMQESGAAAVRSIILPFIDRLVSDVGRVVSGYETKAGTRIDRVVLSGGTSNLPGFAEYVGQKLGRDVALADPLTLLRYPEALVPLAAELRVLFGVAIGLALRELPEVQ